MNAKAHAQLTDGLL